MTVSFYGFVAGEARLTVSVLTGVFVGWVIVKLRVPQRALGKIGPLVCRCGLHPDLVVALALSLGTSRVATGMIASAYEKGDLDRDETVFGTLLLSFPGYLHRWVGTFGASVGLAGTAGALYALSLLLRSVVRFAFFLHLLVRARKSFSSCAVQWEKEKPVPPLWPMIKKTLPWGWGAFALVYWVMPIIEPYFYRLGSSVPPVLLSVALAGIAHNTAALAAAGAGLSAGALSVGDAVFALLLGNLLGTFSRVIRQNLAFWAGVFPGRILVSLMLWHIGTLVPLMVLWVFIAAFFCEVV
ncbi:hypothetical protein [Dethiosulfovibrio salsuginis]|uniref:Uncharacterized protein n=1 Tax=Dethiosulfovibrio salsuginis TaxID=561720 RepID=A0A1X7ICS1_9BACT|nr:hypothetical protein [Dethiosulfovibrio salsuginis]SMG12463.1 hypothetical protein SAMN06275492_101332 [Dethiosulfovibrio salsuginis]